VYNILIQYDILFYMPTLACSTSTFSKKERLVNSDDAEGKDYTEVAVVDNPLYAENEGDVEAYLKEDLAAEYEEDEINKVYHPRHFNSPVCMHIYAYST
jgi:hypothetical protein